MGIQASLTGHLVFSTLHTNDAPSAVTRMVDMGVPAYLVASSVIAILAQRLVRTICPRCKQTYKPSQSILDDAGIPPELIEHAEFAKGRGCSYCQRSGYRGRLGIYELMMVTSQIREKMFKGAATQDIRAEAIKQGMTTLYADGMRKVLRGITTFEEVYRVAKRTEQDQQAMQHLVEEIGVS
jgi:type IV pilus assembly protein PilB